MTTTLIVLTHPDKRSFNGAWAQATAAAATAQGDTVLWSDLYAMGFNPIEAVECYPEWARTRPFDPLKAQDEAAQTNTLPQDVQAEIDKLKRADRVVFHFPLWWFTPPAILKGWFDRVFAHGALHSVDQRFDSGLFQSKKALFCVTTGANQNESSFNGKEGDVSMLLWPTAYTLRYLGFAVLKPKVVHGVHGYHTGEQQLALESRLQTVLRDQSTLIAQFDSRSCIGFNADADFDTDGRLRSDRPSETLFIRHSE